MVRSNIHQHQQPRVSLEHPPTLPYTKPSKAALDGVPRPRLSSLLMFPFMLKLSPCAAQRHIYGVATQGRSGTRDPRTSTSQLVRKAPTLHKIITCGRYSLVLVLVVFCLICLVPISPEPLVHSKHHIKGNSPPLHL